jgi:hypothetical protein
MMAIFELKSARVYFDHPASWHTDTVRLYLRSPNDGKRTAHSFADVSKEVLGSRRGVALVLVSLRRELFNFRRMNQA